MSRADVPDLEALFEPLPLPAGEDADRYFSVAVIPGWERYRIGKDFLARPSLLVAPLDTDGSRPPPLRLERLEVRHSTICRVHYPDGTRSDERLTIVRCTSPELAAYFLRVCESMIGALGSDPKPGTVSDIIARLVSLFEALGHLPRGPVQGLWAELLIIATARDPGVLASAWHTEPTDRFDFSAGRERLEVKSASGYDRQHHFSLDQLRPGEDVDVVIASLYVERAGGGTSIRDLIENVQATLGPGELSLRVEQIVAETLGSGFATAIEEPFDLEHALDSLRLYDARLIPSVPRELPPEISGVHFKCDVSDVQPLREEMAGSGLLQAVRWRRET